MTTDKNSREGVADRYRLSTDEFATRYLVQPQTVRKQYSATGTYFGVAPLALPNGRLLWPDNTIEQLLAARGV